MKYLNSLTARIIAAVVIGLLLAGVGTKITYTCTPHDRDVGCVSFEKAVMHPGDLLSNKQDSLMRFSRTFAVASLASFALSSIINLIPRKKV